MLKVVHSLTLALTLLLSNIAMAEEQPPTIAGATTVSAEEVLALVEESNELVIIDARPVSDYEKGHLPEVVRLSNTDTDAQSLAEVIPSKSTPVVFYCNGVTCARSGESVRIALEAGYEKIYWFRGGIKEWMDKGFPVES